MTPRLVTLFIALVALALAAPVVLGHAELEETDPPDGGTITTPHTMTGTFSESLVGNSGVVIRNAAGDEVASASISDSEDPTILTVELPELPVGEYVARWTATAQDGHTERYTTTFTVAAAATAAPTAAPTAPPTQAAATPSATPSPTPAPDEPGTPTSNTDLLIALLVAGVAVAGVLSYLFMRNRR